MKEKTLILIIALLMTSMLTSLANIFPVEAQGTEIKVINPLTGDGNFTFSADTAPVGTRFNATVWIYNVTDLFAFQVYLSVNETLLNITNAWLPAADDPNYVFYGQTTIRLSPQYYDNDGDGINEAALVGDTILVGTSFTGSGLLAIFEFEIMHTPAAGQESTELNIDKPDTILLDSVQNDIPALRINGYYQITGVPVPTLRVEPSYYRATHIGETFNMSIKIENLEASKRMIGFQFRLSYNISFVEVINMVEGPFLPAFNQTPNPPYTYFMAFDEPDDPYYGTHVVIGDLLMPNATGQYPGPFPQGEGTLAIITFNVTGEYPGTFTFHLFDTMLINDVNEEISHTTIDGTFELYALVVSITQQPNAYYGLSSVALMKFVVQYPDGTYYTADNLGSVTVSLFNGTHYIVNITLTSENFDPITNEWTVEYLIPWTLPLGYYNFVIIKHAIVDSTGNSGPLIDVSSDAFKIVGVTALTVEADVGSIYFLGEKAEFSILTLLNGKRFVDDPGALTATLYKPDGTTETLSITNVSRGFFKASYTINAADPAGAYTLLVEVSYITEETEYAGTAIRSFLVSPTLSAWDPVITNINGTVATIETKLGQVQLDLKLIKANVTAINGTTVTIKTLVGDINTTLYNLKPKIETINGTTVTIKTLVGDINTTLYNLNATITGLVVENGELLVKIDSTLGTVTTDLDDIGGTIETINGNVVRIDTSLGTVTTSLDEIKDLTSGAQSVASTTLYATSALSAITVILAIVILFLLRKK